MKGTTSAPLVELNKVIVVKVMEGCGMKCPKCGGLMVMQSFFDHFINFEGWKCLNCGKIIEKKESTIKDNAFSIFYQKQKIKKNNM